MVGVLIMRTDVHNKTAIMITVLFMSTTIMVAVRIMRIATHNNDYDHDRIPYY